MTIDVGDRLPDAEFLVAGADGVERVSLESRLAGRRVVIFGVLGAFSPTCDAAHIPSFVRSAAGLSTRGVDEILCISVNDPFVMQVWGESSGARAAGIAMLADPACTFTEAIGMRLDIPPVGLLARSRRYALVADDGLVEALRLEVEHDTCPLSGGEAILDLV